MKISIKTLKGKSINVEVEDSSKTIDLKIHGEPIGELVLRVGPGPDRSVAVMKISVTNLAGKICTLEVDWCSSIREVKAKYEEKEGIPGVRQRIIFKGIELEDNRTLADYCINHESTLHMVPRPRGL